MARRTASGFTLLEILVSIMIFSLISVTLVSVLAMATKLFRSGESARAAEDDAVAALSQLDQDLQNIVPPDDGGFLYLRQGTIDSSGAYVADQKMNMILGFKIRNPDRQATTKTASDSRNGTTFNDNASTHARLLVCWYVTSTGWLHRSTIDAVDDPTSSTTELAKLGTALTNPTAALSSDDLSAHCLYFGADLSLDQVDPVTGVGTRGNLQWSTQVGGTAKYCPDGNLKFCTEATGGTADLFPRAIRVSMTLTGNSRHLIQGHVIREDATGIRVGGIGAVPVGPGALAKISNPAGTYALWVQYDRAASSLLTYQNSAPLPVRRADPSVRVQPGDLVEIGASYSLVRTFAR